MMAYSRPKGHSRNTHSVTAKQQLRNRDGTQADDHDPKSEPQLPKRQVVAPQSQLGQQYDYKDSAPLLDFRQSVRKLTSGHPPKLSQPKSQSRLTTTQSQQSHPSLRAGAADTRWILLQNKEETKNFEAKLDLTSGKNSTKPKSAHKHRVLRPVASQAAQPSALACRQQEAAS